jgi:hypothetical protein
MTGWVPWPLCMRPPVFRVTGAAYVEQIAVTTTNQP